MSELSPDVSRRLAKAKAVVAAHPELDFHDVWHSLLLLEMTPRERLELAILRGRASDPR